ncbi:MAG TPA: FAD-binding oxidoreductase [Gammaproteobacteria bacterium]|nr:FAD-binding oxidoreductase [Gammaproteobacteria bacterium]
MSHEKFNLVLQSSRMVTPRVRQLGFVREDGQPLEYVSGQFITLHLPYEDMVLRRSYSIATRHGSGEDEIRIAATYVPDGRATKLLYAMEPGEKVEATGPFGRFVLREDPPARYILVATGTGVSPYRAMLPHLRERLDGTNYSAVLLLGVRGPDELLFGEDFLEFSKGQAGFEFTACYSRQMPEIPGAHEKSGYVQRALAEMDVDPERDIVYLCGNPDMIDAAVSDLKEKGFQNPRLRREKYVSSN